MDVREGVVLLEGANLDVKMLLQTLDMVEDLSR